MYTTRVTKLVDRSKLANKHPNHLRAIREMSYDSTVQYLPCTQKFLASIPFIPPTPNKRLEVNSKQLHIYLTFTEPQKHIKIPYFCVTVTKTSDCVTLYSHRQEVVCDKGPSSLLAGRKQRGARKQSRIIQPQGPDSSGLLPPVSPHLLIFPELTKAAPRTGHLGSTTRTYEDISYSDHSVMRRGDRPERYCNDVSFSRTICQLHAISVKILKVAFY